MAELPIARGLFVCEQIIVDQRTRNVSLINCTGTWSVERLPSAPQQFCVYAALMNGSGDCRLKVRINHLRDSSLILERAADYRFANPLGVLKFSLRVRQCIFPEAGRYSVQLLANDQQIAETVLRVTRTG